MNAIPPPERNWLAEIRPAVRDVAPSGIVEVFNYGRGRQGLIPLWVGEGDLPTPAFISDAAKASLDRGETFYTARPGAASRSCARQASAPEGILVGDARCVGSLKARLWSLSVPES